MGILKNAGRFIGKNIGTVSAAVIGLSEGGVRLLAGQDKKKVDEIAIKRMQQIVDAGEKLGGEVLPTLGIALLGGAVNEKLKKGKKKKKKNRKS